MITIPQQQSAGATRSWQYLFSQQALPVCATSAKPNKTNLWHLEAMSQEISRNLHHPTVYSNHRIAS